MSQRNVERVIGRLVTDEGFRRRFALAPAAALQEIVETGVELTVCELRALAALDPRVLARCADALDPRIQKTDLGGCT